MKINTNVVSKCGTHAGSPDSRAHPAHKFKIATSQAQSNISVSVAFLHCMFVGRLPLRLWRPLYYGSSITVRTMLLGTAAGYVPSSQPYRHVGTMMIPPPPLADRRRATRPPAGYVQRQHRCLSQQQQQQLSVRQRRLLLLQSRNEEKRKRLAEIDAQEKAASSSSSSLDPETWGAFFDTIVPNVSLDNVEDVCARLKAAIAVDIAAQQKAAGAATAAVAGGGKDDDAGGDKDDDAGGDKDDGTGSGAGEAVVAVAGRALTKLLKEMSLKKGKSGSDHRFQVLLRKLVQPNDRKRKLKMQINSTIKNNELIDALIKARDRAIGDGMGWETYMKFTAPPVEDADDVHRAASALARHLLRNLPNSSVKAVQSLCQNYATGGEAISRLSVRIEPITRGHYHFVAKEIAHYFPCPDADVATTLTSFRRSRKRWNAMREKFVTTAITVHQLVQGAAAQEGNNSYEADDEPQMIDAIPYRGTSKKAPKMKKRKLRHVKFAVIAVNTSGGASAAAAQDQVNKDKGETLSRTVLIDNLPIDIEQERLRELYSRCGELESIEIFQRRPDLDPGMPTMEARNSQRRDRIHKLDGNGWERPRTPVYALLAFADVKGYEKALNKSLRLFGMLIDRHPARSVPGTSLTTLFIDNFHEKIKKVEQRLNKKLSSHWTVCLEAGQSNRVDAHSCEIKFPSFAKAYEARRLLADDYSTQWIRTPANAMQWWSRELGFD
jgi:hypothetical protein